MCTFFELRAVLHLITVLGMPTGPHWHTLVIKIVITFNMMFLTCVVAMDSRLVRSSNCIRRSGISDLMC